MIIPSCINTYLHSFAHLVCNTITIGHYFMKSIYARHIFTFLLLPFLMHAIVCISNYFIIIMIIIKMNYYYYAILIWPVYKNNTIL